MTRTQLAAFCLMASMFVIGAMLMAKASDYIQQKAYAEMVTTKGTITVLSTQVDRDREMIYVLDSRNEILLCYQLDVNRNRIDLVATENIQQITARGLGGKDGDGGRRPR